MLHNITISPDGSLCASGGKDGTAMLWDVNEGKHLYSLEADAAINSLCFSPRNYWLCAATDKSIRIWDLETKVKLHSKRVMFLHLPHSFRVQFSHLPHSFRV